MLNLVRISVLKFSLVRLKLKLKLLKVFNHPFRHRGSTKTLRTGKSTPNP